MIVHRRMQRVQEAHEARMALERVVERIRLSAPAFLRTIDLPTVRALLPDEAPCFVLFCITTQGSLGLLVTRAEPEVRTMVIPTWTQADLLSGEEGGEKPWWMVYRVYPLSRGSYPAYQGSLAACHGAGAGGS